MKNSAALSITFFYLLVSSALYAQTPLKPGGGADNMKEYGENLKDYTEDHFRPALPGQEATANKIIQELDKFKDKTTDVDPEALYEYNLGTTAQKVSDNWMADVYELAGNYEYQSPQFCSATEKVGDCYYVSLGGEIFSSPIWEYYVPFQRVEATNIPFLTGYWPQESVMAGLNLFKGSGVYSVTYNTLDSETMSDRAQDGKSTFQFPGMKKMKEESDDALYDGFMPKAMKSIIEGIMGASDSKMEWKERLPPNWEEVVTKYLDELIPDNTATGYDPDGTIGNPTGNPGDGKVDEKVLQHLKNKFDRDISRWRDSGDSVDGHSRMEYHFSTTLYHEIMRNFPEFNKFGAAYGFPPSSNWKSEVQEPITWCHRGAKWAFLGDTQKPIEQLFFGEWVYHGLFARTYAMLSWLWTGLKEFTPDRVDPLNCALKNLVSSGGDTPDDMNLTPENFGLAGVPKHCMASNHNDTIGPITNVHKTHYPALASEQAFRRGLLAAREYPKKDTATHEVRDRDGGNLKRDKYMIFNTEYDAGDPEVDWVRKMFNFIEPKSNHNEEFPRGCTPFDRTKQNEFTADWGGAGYGAANHLNLDYDGHRHVRAHFRFIRCCPWFPILWVGPLPPQTF